MARLDLGAIGLDAFKLLFYVLPKSTTRCFLRQAQTSANSPWILVAPSMHCHQKLLEKEQQAKLKVSRRK